FRPTVEGRPAEGDSRLRGAGSANGLAVFRAAEHAPAPPGPDDRRTSAPLALRWLVLVAAFVSGFCVMVLELLGGRVLSPWFGASLHIWGSLITVFMLALATGYLLGGRWSLRQPSLARF